MLSVFADIDCVAYNLHKTFHVFITDPGDKHCEFALYPDGRPYCIAYGPWPWVFEE